MIIDYPYFPSEAQRQRIARAEVLARRFADRAQQHDREASFPHENIADLRDAGLLALTVPQEYGGAGAQEVEHIAVVETIAWGDASTAFTLGMHLSNIGLIAEGDLWHDQVATLFREVAREGSLLNAAQAEPQLGSPSHGGVPATTAHRQADGTWVLNGRKIYTSGAPGLRYFLTLAAIMDGDEPSGLGTFLVPSDAPGVTVEHTWEAMALRASGSDDLVLNDARVPSSALLNERPVGAPDPRGALGLPWGALTLSAIYTGVAVAARDEAAHFAATRVPTALGKPIGELPAIREKIGEMESLLLISHRLMYGLAADWVSRPEVHDVLRAQAPLVKVITTNNAVRVTDLALRVAGGAGLQQSMRLERLFRDARAGLINAPVDDVALQNAGRAAVTAHADGA